MLVAADHGFGELASWQRMLERHSELFVEMRPGSRIGIVSREASGILPGKRLGGLQASAEVPMLAWQVEDDGMRARVERFAGMSSSRLDLLLVSDRDALSALREQLDGDALTVLKRMIRRGNTMFFVFRTKAELQDAGYEDFLDSLGLAFLGACR
jgi:hypothetical protein